MNSLSFYDKQHIQKVLIQQNEVASIFNHFILKISPFLAQWQERSSTSVWVRNLSVEKNIDKALAEFQSSLLGNISSFQIDAWKRSDIKNEDFIKEYIKGMAISATVKDGMFSRNADALESMLKGYDARGNNLSQAVWNVSDIAKSQLEFYLKSGLSDGRSSSQIGGDVRQLLENPDKRFRRIKNTKGNLVLSQPMKDYHPGQGIYRSARMNALRLTATTTNTAYRAADYDRWSKQDFTLGIEIHRSANNRGPCRICDAMVGEYPKTFKFTGFHPFCICFATPIVMEPKDLANYLLEDTIPEDKVVRTIPKAAQSFVSKNKEVLKGSYWYKDNFNNDGKLTAVIPTVVKESIKIQDISKKVYVECKTVEDMQKYIRENIADNISLEFKKSDLQLMNDIMRQVSSRMEEFNIQKFSSIGKASSSKAHAAWDASDNSLKLNLSKLRNPSSIWKLEEKWREKGVRYTALANEEDVLRNIIDHELGHRLMYQYGMKADAVNIQSIAGRTINGINELNNIGYYAGTNVDEYFAEAFTMYMGPERGKLGKETTAMIERMMNKVKPKLSSNIDKSSITKAIKTAEQKAAIQERWTYRKIVRTENEIRMNKKFETCVLYDKKGNVIIDKRGAATSVSFTAEERAKMKDSILTHNHPRGWGYDEHTLGRIGNSFSKEDMTLTIANNLAEMRAVTPLYTFMMKRPINGWGDLKEAVKVIDRENLKLKNEFQKLIFSNLITIEQANATHFHILWKRVSSIMGWDYSKAKTL